MITNSRFFRSDIEHIKTVFTKVSAIVPTIQQISKSFTDPDSHNPNAFTEVLHFLSDEISSKSSEFETWLKVIEGEGQMNDLDSDTVLDFSEKLEQLVASILLVVQKQSKHHVTIETENTSDNSPDEDKGNRQNMCSYVFYLHKMFLKISFTLFKI
jgi:hypothetical protein